jgi:hypothetical protein
MGIAGGLMKKGPDIPAYEKVDQAKEQGAAISSNLASFDKSRQLAEQTSAADQEILMANLERAMPGYGKLIGGAGGAIGNMLAGRLPMADQGLLMRRSAEGGVSGGIGGSQAGRNLVARDLGLSQMQMTQSGLGALNPFLSTVRSTAVANPMGVGSMYVDPAQWTQNAISENRFGYNAAIGKAKADAANDPMNRFAGALQTVGGMMTGGMGGGAGGLLGGLFGKSGSPATVAGPANQTMHRFTGSGGTAYGPRPSTLPPGW